MQVSNFNYARPSFGQFNIVYVKNSAFKKPANFEKCTKEFEKQFYKARYNDAHWWNIFKRLVNYIDYTFSCAIISHELPSYQLLHKFIKKGKLNPKYDKIIKQGGLNVSTQPCDKDMQTFFVLSEKDGVIFCCKTDKIYSLKNLKKLLTEGVEKFNNRFSVKRFVKLKKLEECDDIISSRFQNTMNPKEFTIDNLKQLNDIVPQMYQYFDL